MRNTLGRRGREAGAVIRGFKPHTALTLYVLAIIVVSVVPSSGVSLWNIDKAGHFVAYTGLAVLVCLTFGGRTQRILGLLGAVALGALLELVQSQVPGRDMSLVDGLVNTFGVLIGLLVFAVGERRVRGMAAAVFGWGEQE